ncbi:MAG TPA: hypothetical protein VGK73_08675 [Polyangiaceae bacterium]
MLLEYQIQTTGLDRFLRDQRTIEQTLERNARRDTARESRVGSERLRIRDSVYRRSDSSAAKANLREEARAKALAQRNAKFLQTIRNRHYQQVERDQRAAESRQLAEQRRADAKKLRETERAEARNLAIRRRTELAERRIEAKRARDSERSLAKDTAIRRRTLESYGKGAARGIGGAARFGLGAARMGAGLAAVGGTFALGNAVASRMDLDSSLRSVANAGFTPGGTKTREELYTETKGRVDAISARGSDPAEIAASMQAILAKTGNYEVASKGIEGVERLAVATGTNLEEMASTFGTAIESIMRASPNMSTDAAVEQAMGLARTFAGHGKFGSVEVSDVASQGAKLIGSASRFSGDRASNIADMSTLVQQAIKGGSTSAEDAATAVKNLPNDLMKAQKRAGLKASDLYDKSGQFKRIEDILPAIFEKTKGKQTELFGEGNIFGNQSMAAVLPLLEEWKRAGGGRAGAAAVKGVFANFRNQTMSEEEVGASYGFVNEGGDRKFRSAMNDFNKELGDKLLPELTKLIPTIALLTPEIVKLTAAAIDAGKWLAENPFQGMALVVGAFMVKELAAVGFAALFRGAIGQVAAGAAAAGAARTAAAASAAGGVATSAAAGGAGAAVTKAPVLARLAGAATNAGAGMSAGIASVGGGVALGGIALAGAGEYATMQLAKERGAYKQEGGPKVGIGGDFQGIAAGSSGPGQGVNIVAAIKALFGAAEEQKKAAQSMSEAAGKIQSNATGPSPRSDPIQKR